MSEHTHATFPLAAKTSLSSKPAPSGVLQRKCACLGSGDSHGECEECRKKGMTLQRRAIDGTELDTVPPIVYDVLGSPGQPMDASTRAFFEPCFGHDFSKVRVHTDAKAAESAGRLDALGYSIGRHIVFAEQQYAPESIQGRRLLAHELVHVVQQARSWGSETDPHPVKIGMATDPSEREADRHAARVLNGDVVNRPVQVSVPAVRRQTSPHVRTGVTFVTRFHPGIAHNHRPTGRWADIQADARRRCRRAEEAVRRHPARAISLSETLGIECSCAVLPPAMVALTARDTIMAGLPLARMHLDHYLGGSGAVIWENVEDILRRDSGVRTKLAAHIRRSSRGHFRISQSDYKVKDFQFAFGAIDRMDYEVNRHAGLVHVWFKDRYEWHPVGFGYRHHPGDVRRVTNCVHAALVELKASGAKDFWMMGDTVVPLSLVTGSGTHTSALPPGAGWLPRLPRRD